MPYTFQPGMTYRMPTHFGPSLGPRQGPDGKGYACDDNPKTTSISVSFLSNPDQLGALLPEGFEVGDRPVVTVTASHMKEIEWLAGRGYNILGVTFPAVFKGKEDTARGPFLTVLWENLVYPIDLPPWIVPSPRVRMRDIERGPYGQETLHRRADHWTSSSSRDPDL